MNGDAAADKSKRSTLWHKENVLFMIGIGVVVFEVIHAEALGHPFHYEFLILAAAFCGVSITLLGDKRHGE